MKTARVNMHWAAALVATLLLTAASANATDSSGAKTAEGPFQPSWESLQQQYQCPDWFRDAKLGIRGHWGPQSQPEQGDSYARNLYVQGSRQNRFHVQNYGHPSRVGFKDLCNLWKAEKFEPEKLMALYKGAGAKYFVAMASDHSNFDNFDSEYQPWNSVSIGPKKDLVGLWAQAARKEGLRFGVTVHSGRVWSWYEVAQGSDKDGPREGVPYDGNLTRADGKGAWWEGYDPQGLYAQNHPPGAEPDQAYVDKFVLRLKDLLGRYKPDLLYFDDPVLPLRSVSEDLRLSLAAHYYNSSITWHGGKNEAVMPTKDLDNDQRKALVWDIERGKADHLAPQPWQTDTCIGEWVYRGSLFESHRYRGAAWVIPMLVDIVSKNGNLLLNIPVRGDGTIDADEVKVLEDMAAWMDVNSEAIFGTRPWKMFGEGPVSEAGRGTEEYARAYSATDIRFTAKGDTLYAFCLALPTADVKIASLGKESDISPNPVAAVELLGSTEELDWKQEAGALVIKCPTKMPCRHAIAFKISLASAAESKPAPPRKPDVIYVPTPQKVVEKMLEMVEVKKGDVVYDLGCGDGRIVVTAAKKYGVKAVGFDIDPQRIKESLANVKANKVEHLVTIKQEDIFTLDLREANVVTLYLLPSLNVRLMPQLEKLKPGSRIVSHDFDMRGAKPLQVYKMTVKQDDYEATEHTIYKWIVPWEKETVPPEEEEESSPVESQAVPVVYEPVLLPL